MSTKLIGRLREIAELNKCLSSDRSEFVVLYGRRRIGKTFLVRQFFDNTFAFSYTGVKEYNRVQQLNNFGKALQTYAMASHRPQPRDWDEAFDLLQQLLMASDAPGKKVVFLDEMPWIDSHKSGFVAALENFWNGWAAHRGDIVLIACGSATSWIVNKLLHSKGGLFNRTTRHIYLRPFTLGEVEQYLDAYDFAWNRYIIAQCYMILGGVPFYLSLLDRSKSLAQNVDDLFFSSVNAPLRVEYGELYASLFDRPDGYIAVVKALAGQRGGMTRTQLAQKVNFEGDSLTTVLRDLERCDFIFKAMRYGNKTNNAIYQVKDFYSLFYYRFVDGIVLQSHDYWAQRQNTPQVVNWQGLSFELLCMQHIEAINRQLGISGIQTTVSTWRSKRPDSRAQIDLVIERGDRFVNLCEIKFANDVYTIDKAYEARMLERKTQFLAETRTRHSPLLTMVTTFGIARNKHSSMIASEVILDNLF